MSQGNNGMKSQTTYFKFWVRVIENYKGTLQLETHVLRKFDVKYWILHPYTINRLIQSMFIRTAAIIRGNHTNCSQFAQAQRLNWLFSKLGGEGAGMMDVLYCILNDSPEALNMMQEEHIKVIISLLEKFGRDPKVLDILCKLCVGSGAAVRSSQNNIADFLLPGKNLLLHTAVVDHVAR